MVPDAVAWRTALVIDETTDFGKRVAQRLRDESVIWLTTVRPDGTPEPSPVWFLWDGESCLIYSQPGKTKLKDLARNPRVALSFDTNGRGGNVVILTGDARVDEVAPPADQSPDYLTKYREMITGIGMQPDTFARGYSVAIRVTPTKLRGH
jgi:PPOX class probable F420-dependent enzyme